VFAHSSDGNIQRNFMVDLLKPIKKNWFAIAMAIPAFLYLIAFLVLILDRAVVLSLTYIAPDLTETYPTLRNYVELANKSEFWDALRRTFFFTLIGTPLELIVGLVLAGLINKEFRGRGIFRSIFIIPLAIPGIVTAIIIWIISNYPFGHINDILIGKYWFFPRIIFEPINWRGSAFAALTLSMLGKVWRDMPISMLILLSGLQAIGIDQYEAAQTMGAGPWQKFRYITIPLLLPAISIVLVLRSIEMWKEFIFPFILAPRYPLLGTLIDDAYHLWNEPAAASAISIILVACIGISTAFLFYSLNWLRKALVKI